MALGPMSVEATKVTASCDDDGQDKGIISYDLLQDGAVVASGTPEQVLVGGKVTFVDVPATVGNHPYEIKANIQTTISTGVTIFPVGS